jgi:enoyl-CoA hydratase/carnithine racemase
VPDGSTYEHILYEVEGGRARVTLNRPNQRNALSLALLEELRDALWEADDDQSVHSVILRGAGSGFSAGYDLAPTHLTRRDDGVKRRTGRGIDDDTWILERFQRCVRTLWEMHKPSIAQIHGHCLAGGTDLALYCDVLIASDDARIGFPPLRNMGAPPNHLWLYNCGPQWTKRLLLTGDSVSGEDAARIGLVMKSVIGRVPRERGRGTGGSFRAGRSGTPVGEQAHREPWNGTDGCPDASATRSRKRREGPYHAGGKASVQRSRDEGRQAGHSRTRRALWRRPCACRRSRTQRRGRTTPSSAGVALG